QRATGIPKVVTSNANSASGCAVTTWQVVNQSHGPRRFRPTNRAGWPSARDQTSTAKHSGLHRAIRFTSETARYASAGGTRTVMRSATSAGRESAMRVLLNGGGVSPSTPEGGPARGG